MAEDAASETKGFNNVWIRAATANFNVPSGAATGDKRRIHTVAVLITDPRKCAEKSVMMLAVARGEASVGVFETRQRNGAAEV